MALKAPLVWFGGKSAIAQEVWNRFGNVGYYVEPFMGSMACLLARPQVGVHEYVNDVNNYLVNFWRAVKADPEALFALMDYPVTETDLHVRHNWINGEGVARLEPIKTSVDFYDIQTAAWWVWGLCCTIGGTSKWCEGHGAWKIENDKWVKGKPGLDRQKPGDPRGYLARTFTTEQRRQLIVDLSERLKDVIVLCGDWKRTCSGYFMPTDNVGILLDPPYDNHVGVYGKQTNSMSDEVRVWAIENTDNYKIALCGYDGEHDMPKEWSIYRWKAQGGYANTGADQSNNRRGDEVVWFSPKCNNEKAIQSQLRLF